MNKLLTFDETRLPIISWHLAKCNNNFSTVIDNIAHNMPHIYTRASNFQKRVFFNLLNSAKSAKEW